MSSVWPQRFMVRQLRAAVNHHSDCQLHSGVIMCYDGDKHFSDDFPCQRSQETTLNRQSVPVVLKFLVVVGCVGGAGELYLLQPHYHRDSGPRSIRKVKD